MAREITYKNESDVKRQVKKILDDFKWKWWMPAANGFGETGVSDFCCLRTGVFIAVETKFGDNELTANQERFLNEVTHEDGFGFVVYETTVNTLKKWNELFELATYHTSRGEKVPDAVGGELLECIRVLTEPLALADQRRAARSVKRRTTKWRRLPEGVEVADDDVEG